MRDSLKILIVFLYIFILLTVGCATITRNERFIDSDTEFQTRNYNAAIQLIEEENSEGTLYLETDQVLLLLDIGMLHFYAGNHESAQTYLTEAENLMEELFSESVTQAVASFLLNDTVIDYAGEPYEELYTNIFKAISYLEEDNFESAFVEIRRLNDKLNLLEDRYAELANEYNNTEDNEISIVSGTTEFNNSALGRYLSMLIYRAEGRLDDARIDVDQFQRAFETQPSVYDFEQPIIDNYLEPSDNARVNLLAFTGSIPVKRKTSLQIRSGQNILFIFEERENENGGFDTVEIDAFPWPSVIGDIRLSFELPFLEKQGSNVARIEVMVDNETAGEMYLLESIENVAFESYKVKEPLIYLKTISRAVVKAIAAEIAGQALESAGFLGSIGRLFTDAAVDASEIADIRFARYLPAFAYCVEILLEPGEHIIALNYYDNGNNLLYIEEFESTEYQSGEFNFYYSYLPE